MRLVTTSLLVTLAVIAPCHAGTLKMPDPPDLEVTGGPRTIAAELRLSEDLARQIHTVKTSPFDRMRYPIGAYTVELLDKNLDKVFTAASPAAAGAATVTVELTIQRFEAVIPRPAYNPYTATVVYRASVSSPDGTVLLSQAATASAQTSKGMMSGFKAQGLAAEAAARAMNDAMTQILQVLLDAEELDSLEGGG